MRKIIIIVLALAVVSGFLFWKFAPNFFAKPQEESKQITLNILGLWDEDNILKPSFEAYKKAHPNITLNYSFTSSKNYLSRVQTRVDQAQDLDIFMMHNSWLPVLLKSNSLSPMSQSVMSIADYKKDFYPVVSQTLAKDGKVYAIPRGVDGLALYYNEELLRNGGVKVIPQNWQQFIETATRLTVIGQDGKMTTAGAALGTASNVDHWSDILGLLFYQNPGADLENPANSAGAEVVKFYTNFVTQPSQKTWDLNMESSTQAFASGKLAFYIAPSWRAFELRQINPELKFKTAPVPQLPGRNVGWGTFWAYSVARTSKNPDAAWEFLKFFTSKETQKLLYQEASKIRLFGLPYSRIELQKELADDPVVGSFVNQAPVYKSWYLSSNTFDNPGINDAIIKYYEDAINAVLQGAEPISALETTQQGVKQVLNQYNPNAPAEPSP
ncbi:extracellular solute-binding protein [Candidatus Daviesbacteria bacterium]|nr:extracellular solute-binding protein [Candidatus Daviesbacteria bacterium]